MPIAPIAPIGDFSRAVSPWQMAMAEGVGLPMATSVEAGGVQVVNESPAHGGVKLHSMAPMSGRISERNEPTASCVMPMGWPVLVGAPPQGL